MDHVQSTAVKAHISILFAMSVLVSLGVSSADSVCSVVPYRQFIIDLDAGRVNQVQFLQYSQLRYMRTGLNGETEAAMVFTGPPHEDKLLIDFLDENGVKHSIAESAYGEKQFSIRFKGLGTTIFWVLTIILLAALTVLCRDTGKARPGESAT